MSIAASVQHTRRNIYLKSCEAAQVLLLRELESEFGLTHIFISHSLLVVAQVATRIAVTRAGQLVEVGLAEQDHAYTRELLGAVPALPGL